MPDSQAKLVLTLLSSGGVTRSRAAMIPTLPARAGGTPAAELARQLRKDRGLSWKKETRLLLLLCVVLLGLPYLCVNFVAAGGQVVLLALPGLDLGAVEAELARQLAALPRSGAAAKALAHSCIVRVPDAAAAVRLSNLYAPEHLIVNVDAAEAWLPQLDNAGSVFLGRWCDG